MGDGMDHRIRPNHFVGRSIILQAFLGRIQKRLKDSVGTSAWAGIEKIRGHRKVRVMICAYLSGRTLRGETLLAKWQPKSHAADPC